MPRDAGFEASKRIRQGGRLDPRFRAFADRFAEHYGFPPLDVVPDTIRRGPRLSVVLERTAQYARFHTEAGNFDPREQRTVARLFAASVASLDACFGLTGVTSQTIFVCFDDFESVAVREVHDLAVRDDLDAFVARLELGDAFWCARRFSGPPIVFVHTEDQAVAVRGSDRPKAWADHYFALARRHDEFGFLRRDKINIVVDSRQNFDANYASNWFYYFR